MAVHQPTDQIRPPNETEVHILDQWLRQSKSALDALESFDSPYAEFLDDFCGLMYGVLHPDEAE